MEQTSDVLDRASALASVGGDQEFLRELAGIAQAAWPTLLQDIREALAGGKLSEVVKFAHLVKVTAQFISARKAYSTALQLEKAGAYGDLEGARQAGSRLGEELDRLDAALASLGNDESFCRS